MLRAVQASGVLAVAGSLEAAWSPQFLTAPQDATLIALGERIIPGSTAAQCDRFIDLMMTIETKIIRDQLLHSLAAFDAAAQQQYGSPFSRLQPQQQDKLLEEASAERAPLNPEFLVIKEWMADAYWTSRQGLHDLGWNGQMAWPAFPGCEHRQS
ncbi:MAG TPA: gluconate 2-dehydrogenase subunit 3 family protein [Bryobacteraceae bacterium]|nr:gluconate 2-dehydrogenase subunit 3 family protein [Bryobacteraceae bacterium]